MNMHSIGAIGYESYAKKTGNKTYDGKEMPKWEELPERTKEAWEAAANAIADAITAAVLT